ncbi:MAG: N-acetylglucosamine kinase [Rhodoglobus sp.]|nr:N-acetylglucosamine kinase [Rhodoglobus sp.]
MSYVIAVDGGGSKTDAVALALDGTLLGRASAGTSSPHFIGVGPSVAVVDSLVRELAGDEQPSHVGIYLSGLDLEREVEDYRAALAGFAWAASLTVENDLFALLRAGTSAPDAAAVICGTGLNALAIRADGEVARFLALGPISGDWGGGGGIGELALWFAARESDGRGERTSLTTAIPAEFGLATVGELTEALHSGSIGMPELARLSPIVLEHSRAGDPIAQHIVDRQSEEIAVMASAALKRLGLGGADVPVVLGGGVVQSGDARLLTGVDAALARLVPRAHAVVVHAPPILGAGLLALESTAAESEAVDRARAALA